jgi:gamma-glutamyl-gamma-aminobutyrate hydrolase PuuD
MARKVAVTYRSQTKLTPYAEALCYAGIEAKAQHPDEPWSLDGVHGLLISGGTDVSARLYSSEPSPHSDPPDDARDLMELTLVREALDRDLPVLAICRGMQLLNVALGGTLIPHLPQTEAHRQRGVMDAHAIQVMEGTRLAAVIGPGPLAVNSRHHQAVDALGEGLRISARSSDGVVEAIEIPDRRFILGVQWHPEDRVPAREADTRLFQAFARAIE